MVIFAIETAEGTGRQYLSGSPYFIPTAWQLDGKRSTTREGASKMVGDACTDVVKMKDLKQQVLEVPFYTYRVFPSPQKAEEFATELDQLQRWSGTAVKMIQHAADPHRWTVYKGANAYLGATYWTEGVRVCINYTLSLGKWVKVVTAPGYELHPPALHDEGGWPVLGEDGQPILLG